MPSASTADFTVSWQTDKDLLLRAGIRNLADKTVRDPSSADGFRDDLPRGDRTLWIGLSYQPKS